jgi:hypothetical protein
METVDKTSEMISTMSISASTTVVTSPVQRKEGEKEGEKKKTTLPSSPAKVVTKVAVAATTTTPPPSSLFGGTAWGDIELDEEEKQQQQQEEDEKKKKLDEEKKREKHQSTKTSSSAKTPIVFTGPRKFNSGNTKLSTDNDGYTQVSKQQYRGKKNSTFANNSFAKEKKKDQILLPPTQTIKCCKNVQTGSDSQIYLRFEFCQSCVSQRETKNVDEIGEYIKVYKCKKCLQIYTPTEYCTNCANRE